VGACLRRAPSPPPRRAQRPGASRPGAGPGGHLSSARDPGPRASGGAAGVVPRPTAAPLSPEAGPAASRTPPVPAADCAETARRLVALRGARRRSGRRRQAAELRPRDLWSAPRPCRR
jgi:hypothetical protein